VLDKSPLLFKFNKENATEPVGSYSYRSLLLKKILIQFFLKKGIFVENLTVVETKECVAISVYFLLATARQKAVRVYPGSLKRLVTYNSLFSSGYRIKVCKCFKGLDNYLKSSGFKGVVTLKFKRLNALSFLKAKEHIKMPQRTFLERSSSKALMDILPLIKESSCFSLIVAPKYKVFPDNSYKFILKSRKKKQRLLNNLSLLKLQEQNANILKRGGFVKHLKPFYSKTLPRSLYKDFCILTFLFVFSSFKSFWFIFLFSKIFIRLKKKGVNALYFLP